MWISEQMMSGIREARKETVKELTKEKEKNRGKRVIIMKKKYRCETANVKCHSMGEPRRSQQQPAQTDLTKCFSLKFIFRHLGADRGNEFKTFPS